MANTFIADYDLIVSKNSKSISIRVPEDESRKKRNLFILGSSKKSDMIKQDDQIQVILCDKVGDFYEASVLELEDTLKFIQIRTSEEPDRYKSGRAIVHNMKGR